MNKTKFISPALAVLVIIFVMGFSLLTGVNKAQASTQIPQPDPVFKRNVPYAKASVNHLTCPNDMVLIPGGKYTIGANDYYKEEKSVDDVRVNGFCLDRHEVTNAEFAKFVKETGYVTVAERPLSIEEFPTLSEAERTPGSVVFQPVPEGQAVQQLDWWHWVPGANWQHPEGPDSDLKGRENHPVVHVAFEDAQAYAQWVGKELPTESQWEFAARGGLSKMTYVWGKQYSAKKANTWQGKFPWKNTQEDGYVSTAPVGSFPPNNYGLYDMAGNVWEWTRDWYRPNHDHKSHQTNPVVLNASQSFDPREPGVAKHVIKGGSFLCAPNYCSRYRPAAREAEEPNTGMSHIGFRLVKNQQ